MLAAVMAAACVTACSTFDCPLNNKVYASVKLDATLDDTLTVSIPLANDDDGSDTVVVNRLTAADSLALPMSYSRQEDMYIFTLRANGTAMTTHDTLWVTKTNEPHFESVDCSPAVFHTITGVKCTHNAINDIRINNDKVTYNDAKAHIYISLKGGNR